MPADERGQSAVMPTCALFAAVARVPSATWSLSDGGCGCVCPLHSTIHSRQCEMDIHVVVQSVLRTTSIRFSKKHRMKPTAVNTSACAFRSSRGLGRFVRSAVRGTGISNGHDSSPVFLFRYASSAASATVARLCIGPSVRSSCKALAEGFFLLHLVFLRSLRG